MGPTSIWKVLSFKCSSVPSPPPASGGFLHSVSISPIWKEEKAKHTFRLSSCEDSRWKLSLSLIVPRGGSKGREKRGSFSLSLPAAFAGARQRETRSCLRQTPQVHSLAAWALRSPSSGCSGRRDFLVMTFWLLFDSNGVCDFNSCLPEVASELVVTSKGSSALT